MEETKFLTPEGFERLHQELVHLRTIRRPEIAQHIRIAKEDGDLTENAGYDAAKEEQAHVEGRIMTLEAILKNAQIIRVSGDRDIVSLGATITVQEEGFDPEEFQMVGSAEANPAKGRISNESPLGKALMGRSVGDTVQVNTPGGVLHFTILGIQ
jgi:transcription elongation factor GreA